ncbi:MAG: urease accessory protein [bacterium]|nr:urease accessory protein [bacterium]
MEITEIPGLLGGVQALASGAGPSISGAGAWLALAFGLGLVHALDADHVMALSVFAADERGGRRGLRRGLGWSLGHGVVLLGVGVALLGLGRALPTELFVAAERAVGLAMVALGLYVWVDLARRRRHVHFHEHDGFQPHAHWHSHTERRPHPRADRHHHAHAASMVGALHGLAGSAPILALLPTAARSPVFGIAYLLLFGLGVAVAMALVSGALGHLAARLTRSAQSSSLTVLRGLSATGSIVLGVWLGLAA